MSRVVEHLAELTGFRDRDLLDATLVGGLKDLLRPRAVAIYRCIGEPTQSRRWLTRASLGPGEATASADPLWADIDSLPLLSSVPDRLACLTQQQALYVPGTPAKAYFPLTSDREVVGVLELHTEQPLSDEDARMVGGILRIYRNFHDLLDYSERDTLTGLLNRKTFDDSFLRVAVLDTSQSPVRPDSGARRRSGPGTTWLGLIDIDHFKRVNDNFGHLIGDEALLLLSRLMRSSFRIQDHLYRFGGEEFVVLVRCDSNAAAAAAFERLRSNVERYVFPQIGQLTVSVGFTQLRHGDTPSVAFERADKAVYYAKQNGRNQVFDHAALVAQGKLAEESRDSDVELF
jgi:diguanylate cyclase (GGDEF)-like protein